MIKYFLLIIIIYSSVNIYGQIVQKHTEEILYNSKGFPQPGAMYPRIIRITNYKKDSGSLLSTFEQYIDINKKPSFPVYRSADDGITWKLYSRVSDTKNKYGMRYQPQLFELNQPVSGMPAGTILCAGSSIPKNFSSTELMLYKSVDGGRHWSYMSSIVKGGGVGPTIPDSTAKEKNGILRKNNNPVWEPFLEVDSKGRLICFFSDERFKNNNYNQLLAHKISEDGGKTWGNEVFDVAIPDNIKRPGMIVTAHLPNGKYIMVYEVVGVENNPIYYRFSNDGENWGDASDLGKRIVDSINNFFMSGTPYIIWTPAGGENGTLVVTAKATIKNGKMFGGGIMINNNLGNGSWKYMPTIIQYNAELHAGGYSRSMVGTDKGKEILLLTPAPAEGNRSNIVLTREKVIE